MLDIRNRLPTIPSMTTTMNTVGTTTNAVLAFIKARAAHKAKFEELAAAENLAESRKTPTGRLSLKDKKALFALRDEKARLCGAMQTARNELVDKAGALLRADEVMMSDRRNAAEAALLDIFAKNGINAVDASGMYDEYIKRYNAAHNENLDLVSNSKYGRYFRIPGLNYEVTERNYSFEAKVAKKPAEVHVAIYYDDYANVREVCVMRGELRPVDNTRNTSPLVDSYRVEIGMKGNRDVIQSFSSHHDTAESMRVYAKVLNLVADILQNSDKIASQPLLSPYKYADEMVAKAEEMLSKGELAA